MNTVLEENLSSRRLIYDELIDDTHAQILENATMLKPLKLTILFLALAATCGLLAPSRATAAAPTAVQIAGAVLPAPEDQRDTATVHGYNDEGALVTLRQGSGEFVCLADDPARDNFHVACYHKSLEPFMARGRELKAEGKGADRHKIRNEEAKAGKLKVPKIPAALFSITADADKYDPATGKVRGANRVYVIYMPYATGESTGFPPAPIQGQPSAPWIMREGTASAHLMITPGPEAEEP